MSGNATFWDRRKAAVRAETEAKAQADEATRSAESAQEQAQALPEKSDENILTELGLPDPDTMVQGDDFSAFMAKAVPEQIRKRALRKLWRSNPVLACVDGLNDYDDDYLSGSYGNAPVETSYQVGKGLMAHVLEMARQEEREADDLTRLDKDEILVEDDIREESVERAADDLVAASEPVEELVEEGIPPKPRRMTFHFDGNNT